MNKQTKGGFDIESSLGYLLSKCHQKAFQVFRQKLLAYGLTPPQFALLAFLWKKDEQSQIQLGKAMEMDRTTISGIIDRLAKQGLVSRMPHPEDRRVFMINLTDAGKNLEASASGLSVTANAQAAANLSEQEQATLVDLLKKMRGESNDK
ncbi:MarR family transcriptional regulator [Sporomusaceae bacterium FL31]|nr:MarR family transcriptional regulator [Sporomusaceae bacterium FL31]GCE33179.1 MarR family transcriptional regulator [Sporomusaceae bacterium]